MGRRYPPGAPFSLMLAQNDVCSVEVVMLGETKNFFVE
jgi:hypothetical protein